MTKYYQTPECLEPLDADEGTRGTKSDHLIVTMEPISAVKNVPMRNTREVQFRPLKMSGMNAFKGWLKSQSWQEVYDAENIDDKATIFQKTLMNKVDEFLPQKTIKISDDDQPFLTEKIKKLKRIMNREFHKNRKSLKWHKLDAEIPDNGIQN